ncbi:cell division protein FtsQ/DivIB [Gallibacterium salpingitidis]|uniref:Cell division protein FtsQ n=1 Tax=Gallibacterium salpingitidis TaxID=505341 RepID=A0A1A7NNZ5_9PAST|nr:cell division protein FtsQ/DivIB [Gallibacterium salpingitidis]OBW91343.1 cell division protein FtsQ [Gallibacterium salpingitidis]
MRNRTKYASRTNYSRSSVSYYGKPEKSEPFISLKGWLRLILYIVIAGIAYYGYSHRMEFLEKLDPSPIHSFNLKGNPLFTTNDDVREMLKKYADSHQGLRGYFGQDVESIEKMFESLSWIKSISIRKIWPAQLNISVTEYIPAAKWNDVNYLTSDGTIFSLPKGKINDDNLPHLSGPDFQGVTVLKTWYDLSKILQGKNITLKFVTIDDRGSWNVTLSNDIILKLGRGEWKDKIDRFLTIYPQIEIPENKKIAYIDLRYNTGAAVSFADAPQNTENTQNKSE